MITSNQLLPKYDSKPGKDNAPAGGRSMPSRTIVYPKLEMTTPESEEEKEADAVARDIMAGGKVARSISGGGQAGGIAVSSQMESQLGQLQGQGQPMPEALRGMMERGFGRDFSQVRLHTDGTAAEMSSSISAKAFTHGNDIYFGHGQYSPSTTEGQQLVAHELTHVAQGNGKVAREEDPDDVIKKVNTHFGGFVHAAKVGKGKEDMHFSRTMDYGKYFYKGKRPEKPDEKVGKRLEEEDKWLKAEFKRLQEEETALNRIPKKLDQTFGRHEISEGEKDKVSESALKAITMYNERKEKYERDKEVYDKRDKQHQKDASVYQTKEGNYENFKNKYLINEGKYIIDCDVYAKEAIRCLEELGSDKESSDLKDLQSWNNNYDDHLPTGDKKTRMDDTYIGNNYDYSWIAFYEPKEDEIITAIHAALLIHEKGNGNDSNGKKNWLVNNSSIYPIDMGDLKGNMAKFIRIAVENTDFSKKQLALLYAGVYYYGHLLYYKIEGTSISALNSISAQ